MDAPLLTFACELPAGALQALFDQPEISDHLLRLGAQVSLGIIDLSPARAQVVRQLNAAGIPVIAWQLLEKADGYWYNLLNAPQAAARYAAFQEWSAVHGLHWSAVAIDIEPNINQLGDFTASPKNALRQVIANRLTKAQLRVAQTQYVQLVARMQADGYKVQSYVIPPIVDERRSGASLLRRLFKLGDIPTPHETLMLYTSFMGAIGPGVLWSYGHDAQVVGVGSTGGGVEEAGLAARAPLTWAQFARDLRLARRWSDEIFIFSLEGSVREGFLARLHDFDWHATEPVPPHARAVSCIRGVARFVLRTSRVPVFEAGWLWLARLGVRLAVRTPKPSK